MDTKDLCQAYKLSVALHDLSPTGTENHDVLGNTTAPDSNIGNITGDSGRTTKEENSTVIELTVFHPNTRFCRLS